LNLSTGDIEKELLEVSKEYKIITILGPRPIRENNY